jgi:F0F1-type ATP synthase delta subunit
MNTVIFLVLTIVPLIIIILYYFGIFRYFQLHLKSSEKYINNYKNLKKGSDNKVIISFTTTPKNISKIRPMINSILDQTVKVNGIYLNIPENEKYKIPKDFNKILNIFVTKKDYGEINKFIPTMLREDNSDTIIILLDDDYIYGKDFIESIIEENKNNDIPIISKKAILLKPKFIDADKFFDRDKGILKDNWIEEIINTDKKKLKYNENYKSYKIK